MTAALALHPDTLTAKYRAVKDWKDSQNRRTTPDINTLSHWDVARLDTGELFLSARIMGPAPEAALLAFEHRQSTNISAFGDMAGGDRLPSLDCTVRGRTACVWRLNGVWVEVWYPDTPAHRPGPPVAAPRAVPKPGPPAVSSPSGRLPLGAHRTTLRRTATNKEQ